MRQVKFCAGHRLLGHEGKCANLHGHNYVVEFHITGREFDELGRVVDFQVINHLFKGWIDENWDHGFLIWTKDEDAIRALRQVSPNRVYELPYNPTAENMARYLFQQIAPVLIATVKGYDLHCTKVVVWETENAFAEVSADESRVQADAMLENIKRASFG
jgi:6-pyruvoyltetrahydropterin/6-carboxytetrahydropterin synthase